MPRTQNSLPPDTTLATRHKRALAQRLLAWYARRRRDLPWRRTPDPYAIWVSEVMLQQTQVATVVDYFNRFLAAFPTVRALAEAREQKVLKLWEGLGYYRRARNMHRAAQVVVKKHAGRFPRELAALTALPGIGRYTAGAIRSIAFDLPAPILEANTVRLFSRLVGYGGDTSSVAGRGLLWQVAESLLPRTQCGPFNSALMELGSQVCLPRDPRCDDCPIRRWCVACERGQQDQIPRARGKPITEQVREAAVVVRRGRRVLLRQRGADERWAGMWDFLRFQVSAEGNGVEREIRAIAEQSCGLKLGGLEHLATLKHGVTRFRITLDCYQAAAAGTRVRRGRGTWRWVRPDELAGYPLSTTGRKLARLVADAAAGEKRARRAIPARNGSERARPV